LLGATPKLRPEGPREALSDPRSGFSEALLVIEANLTLSTDGSCSRSLAVVSARPGEGASTTAAALARTLARAGQKVILIDANLRSPSVHSTFRLPNAAGLGDVLAGRTDIETVVRDSGFEGLSVVTAGAQASNPGDLLIGTGLARLVKTLQGRFDRVILDGPSIMDLADAPLVASAADGVICVVGAKGTSAGKVRAAVGRLQETEILGGVLTFHEARRALFRP